MLAELFADFAQSENCRDAFVRHVWNRRSQEEARANQARLESYTTRKAFRTEEDETLRANGPRAPIAPRARRSPRPITVHEVLRVLRA